MTSGSVYKAWTRHFYIFMFSFQISIPDWFWSSWIYVFWHLLNAIYFKYLEFIYTRLGINFYEILFIYLGAQLYVKAQKQHLIRMLKTISHYSSDNSKAFLGFEKIIPDNWFLCFSCNSVHLFEVLKKYLVLHLCLYSTLQLITRKLFWDLKNDSGELIFMLFIYLGCYIVSTRST